MLGKLRMKVERTTLIRMFRAVDVKARGSYRATIINSKHLQRIVYLMAFASILRGLDYLVGNAIPTPTIDLTESIAQLPVWGVAYIFASLLLVYGTLRERILPTLIAHTLLVVLYGMTTIVTLQTTLPTLDNFRGVGPLLVMAYLHYRGIVLLGFPFRRDSKGKIVPPSEGA